MCRPFLILSSLCFFRNAASSNPSVETNVGVIQGLNTCDGNYSMYLGIPFASVNPSNPFGAATECSSFDETYEAYDDTSTCPQVYQFNSSIVGSLSCLRLNIYVPSTASSINKLPVMVWLYGGAFKRGFGGRVLFGPDYLIRYDVILVTVNYRVGPYGFMCLDTIEVPGNQGLKDQYMGIKWVYDNIDAFGGDVNNITLFGESAGGHSVELHLRSPKDKLFNKVIIQSSSAVAASVLTESDKEAPLKMANYLGYFTTDINEALAFLAKSEPKQVINASEALDMLFKPCVEKNFGGVDNFITNSWIDAPVPKVANMSVLLGFNENELMISYVNKKDTYFKKLDVFKDRLNQTFNFSDDNLTKMVKIVRHFYIGDKSITKDVQWPISDFDSDFTYIHPVQRSINKFIESGAANIYYYMFSYSGGRNFGKKAVNTTLEGTAHADELGYLFSMTYMPDKPTTADQLVIDRMSKMWTNFAKYSNPTPETTDLLPIKWIPLTANASHCMKINSSLTLVSRPLKKRMAFWDLFYKANKASQRTFDDADSSK